MFQRIALLALFLGSGLCFAQEKKSLTHEDYNLWKRVQNTQISKDGNTIVTTIVTGTGRGNGYIKIYNAKTGESFTFENGYNSRISGDGNYVYFLRKPAYELTRSEKKEEVKEEKRTKDAFFIYDVATNKILDSVQRVKKFEAPEDVTGWVVIEKHKDLKPEKDTTAAKASEEKEKDSLKTRKPENLALKADYALVYHLKKGKTDSIFQIKDLALPKEGNRFIFSTTKGEKKGDLGVFAYDVREMSRKQLDTGRYSYTQLAIDNSGQQLAYISAKDSTETDSLKYELFYVKDLAQKQLTDTLGKNLKKNWKLSAAQQPQFSENGKRLFFYSRPVRDLDVDTTLLDEEIPQVDVWSYKDKLIQPEQKARLEELKDKAYRSFYDTSSGQIVQLHDETLEYIKLGDTGEQRYALGYTSTPYNVQRSWEYPWLRDYYIVDTQTGEKRLAIEAQAMDPDLSPDGNFAVYYDMEDRNWWVLDLKANTKRSLTKDLQVNFFDEENDVPTMPWPYGFGGFTEDGKVLLYDQFDIWSTSLAKAEKPVNITRDGRKNQIVYRTLRLDPDHRNNASTYHKDLLVTAFDEKDKSEALFSLNSRNGKKQVLIEDAAHHLSDFELAENDDNLVFAKENFQHFPDVHLLKGPKSQPVQLTNANPQQQDFKWGTVEMISWEAYDGTQLDGLLYKPEDFDPNKKYPLITYFYEKRSDNLNRYHSPQPSASIVNMSYLVSNDYVVFVPDIVYKEGKPGESAYNAIVSGVEAVEELGFIDSENMAIQGQSWGGYQVAHLVTVTNKFKAAMAGAPVSNMTSAYGGIRWQSGLSRAFQYEKTQSRIGKNLWEGFDLYIENSPLFGIPNIETPLLIMHNDEDGAVPYYQGIEMFMGMRRLNKPVWLLVYNDEAHNLRKTKNRFDLSIRMMQFFDHYLKGAPAPEWMTQGVPAVMKGKDLRYDLDVKATSAGSETAN
ncbi:Prolyl oligopeptidase family protein [Salinimicrobium catena]|uniref:Prolyl oligopeptidase family protein n=1 Tax=Salinimicrobium catena TaxID=390640 RepID=A0A1H5HSD0_9FLAO|nr:prolyl oligopeptidase family serine peptidase [Salinimicrobium catena]SDK72332.1 Prolyl oligopeptidase family protein [Salinimicrobium catena]SEE30882.1 Prolyl oligopeptidase family protein [Salinimicrobium catena]